MPPSTAGMTRHPVSGWQVVVWGALLVLPVVALARVAAWWEHWWYVAGGMAVLSLVSHGMMRGDKRRAMNGEWRTPESRLHLLELAGGWPGSFLAQRRYRHKVSKGSYQAMFWLIVLAWEFAAYDFLNGWGISRQVYEMVKGWSAG